MTQTVRLADAAYFYLKNKLTEGKFTPGERLRVAPVAEAVGASRQPVMDAIKRLAQEGFLEIVPQIGTKITLPSPQIIVDFVRAFVEVEGLTSELAALRAEPSERDSLVEMAESGFREMEIPKTKERRQQVYSAHNRLFHANIHKMARSPVLTNIADNMADRMDFYMNSMLRDDVMELHHGDALLEHKTIALKIKNSDAKGARESAAAHLAEYINLFLPNADDSQQN